MFKKLNLFSKTEMKALEFISSKDGEMYEKQIASGAHVSTGSANRILKEFARMNIIKLLKKGNMSFYQRNDGNTLLRQFKVFMTMNNLMPIIEKIRTYSARIILFGSCATGRNGENSDIDIFILAKDKQAVRKIIAEYEKVQAIILDAPEYVQLQAKDTALYSRINSGIELYGGEDG